MTWRRVARRSCAAAPGAGPTAAIADGGPRAPTFDGGSSAASADGGSSADAGLVGTGNGASFVEQSGPARVIAGHAFTAAVTMRNIGRTAWSRAAGYYLGSAAPRDNFVFGKNDGMMMTFPSEWLPPQFAGKHVVGIQPGFYEVAQSLKDDGPRALDFFR